MIAPVDLVITDILMPTMDGLEVVRSLEKSHPDTKIIAISADSESVPFEYLRHAQAFGADRIFHKPFNAINSLKQSKN